MNPRVADQRWRLQEVIFIARLSTSPPSNGKRPRLAYSSQTGLTAHSPPGPLLARRWDPLERAPFHLLAGSTGKKCPVLSCRVSPAPLPSAVDPLNFVLLSSRLLIRLRPCFISLRISCRLLGRLRASSLFSRGNRLLVLMLYRSLGRLGVLKYFLPGGWRDGLLNVWTDFLDLRALSFGGLVLDSNEISFVTLAGKEYLLASTWCCAQLLLITIVFPADSYLSNCIPSRYSR